MRISSETLFLESRLGYKDAVRYLCESGFDAIDYSLINKDIPIYGSGRDKIIDELKDIASSFGVVFNQSHAPYPHKRLGEGYEEYNALTHIRNLEAIEIAAALGIEQIVIHPICYSYTDQDENIKRNIEDFYPFFESAKKFGVKIAVENMWGRHRDVKDKIIPNVCSTGTEFCRFVNAFKEEYGKKWVGACLDIGHCGLVGDRADDAIRKLGGNLTALHIHDNDLRTDLHIIPFFGNINFDEILTALSDVGYRGDLTFESNGFFPRLPTELFKPTLAYMRSVGEYLRGALLERNSERKR